MAQIELLSSNIKTRRKVHPFLRIDMTPMVDLGFLLITFFIFTTIMADKKAMRLIMPSEGGKPPAIKESEVLTVLLKKNNIAYAYEGKFDEALQNNRIITTSYDASDGIGKLIREKQKQLQGLKENGKEKLIYLIKPSMQASYKNIIDALDETTINNVKKYMVVDPGEEEKTFLQKGF